MTDQKRIRLMLQSQFKYQEFNAKEALNGLGLSIHPKKLNRLLNDWIKSGVIRKSGNKRYSCYAFINKHQDVTMLFLDNIEPHKRDYVLEQLRDLWTYHSTAIEGNTFSLNDTYDVLQYGLTISGKTLAEHQEVVGHKRALDMLYDLIESGLPVTKDWLFDMHKAVQAQHVIDIYKPMGDWKIELNGTRAKVKKEGVLTSVFVEYSHPAHVDALMNEFIDTLNQMSNISMESAPKAYAKLHLGFASIHPFWDGNGRLARLVSNIPLLKSGLPPIVISNDFRKEYIETLADYQVNGGIPSLKTGVWPIEVDKTAFEVFCLKNYEPVLSIFDEATQDSSSEFQP
ncbi:MAG: Fic family protein [Methyloprofundus sp.]|nr:Fic family protein [Methyloprofundus sp.]